MTDTPTRDGADVSWTAGPWSISNGCDQYIVAEGKWIASTMGVRGAEGAANARLIAAAPDLYDALEDALAFVEEAISWATDSELGSLIDRRERYEALLARARGAA